jgi:hypothetical protein
MGEKNSRGLKFFGDFKADKLIDVIKKVEGEKIEKIKAAILNGSWILNAQEQEYILSNFFVSYTMPYKNIADFIFENGFISIDNSKIELRGPRETFDQNGSFIVPPVIKTIFFERDLWGDSHKSMMEHFIDSVDNKMTIPIDQFIKSLDTNRYILKHKLEWR